MSIVKFAPAMARLGTETAFEVLVRARALEAKGRKIVHLEIGEPDFETPENVRRAAQKALNEGWTHYGPSAGLPQARAAVAEEVSRTRGIKVAPEEVIVTPGGKPVMFLALLALAGPGDEVLYPNPGFPIYESMINFCGAKAVPLPIREENDFNFDPAEFEALLTPKTRLVILNSPANPTGGVMGRDSLERVVRALARFPDAMVLTDEIYSRILYEGEHLSLASWPGMKERCIILDGFSKTFAMTGWRLGYGVARRELIDAMAKLATNCYSCTPSFAQIAAIEALTGPQDAVKTMVAEFRRRRDAIVAGLNQLPGFTCRNPKGAFYAFPNVRGTGLKSKVLADTLLDRAGVACLAGTAFGAEGEGYLRFSYANSVENIQAALESMRLVLPELTANQTALKS